MTTNITYSDLLDKLNNLAYVVGAVGSHISYGDAVQDADRVLNDISMQLHEVRDELNIFENVTKQKESR